MASALALSSSRTTLIFFLLSLLVLSNILVGVKLAESIFPSRFFCTTNRSNYTEGSKFQVNLSRLLIRSLYNNSGNSIYASRSEGEDPDKVHGVFLCRGDVAPKDCQNCIDVASEQILRRCPHTKVATIWYDECLIRYSNVSFVSTLDYSGVILYNTRNVSRPKLFKRILGSMFDNLTYQATSVNPNLKYAANSDDIHDPLQTLYGMVQCLPDLSAADCRACLNHSRSAISTPLSDATVPRGGRVLYASCNIRYELYPFFNPGGRDPGAPQPSTSHQGNQDKGLLVHLINCTQ